MRAANYCDSIGARLLKYRHSARIMPFSYNVLIDLYETTGEPNWLDWANTLQETQNSLFYDNENSGFFEFGESEDIVFDRPKNGFDGAMPSSNSVSTKNLARLG